MELQAWKLLEWATNGDTGASSMAILRYMLGMNPEINTRIDTLLNPLTNYRVRSMENLIFVDCEATNQAPCVGKMTEFGAVHFKTKETFHGVLHESTPSKENPAISELTGKSFDEKEVFIKFEEWLLKVCNGKRPIFVSDNPAFDFQWINDSFWRTLGRNPFGHSGRRISDFYAGLVGDFTQSQGWKSLRVTPHDHNPVNDAMGNVEAFERLLTGER